MRIPRLLELLLVAGLGALGTALALAFWVTQKLDQASLRLDQASLQSAKNLDEYQAWVKENLISFDDRTRSLSDNFDNLLKAVPAAGSLALYPGLCPDGWSIAGTLLITPSVDDKAQGTTVAPTIPLAACRLPAAAK
jgi:hypothetical protein